jgi:hypothetical protein
MPANVGDAHVDERRSWAGKAAPVDAGRWKRLLVLRRSPAISWGKRGGRQRASEVWSSASGAADNAGPRWPLPSGRPVSSTKMCWRKVIEQAEAGAAPSSVVLPGAGLPKGGPTPCSPWVLGPKRLRTCLEEAVIMAKAVGSGVRRSTIGCSCRKCRLQTSVRGILPALSRWVARPIKSGAG